MNTAPMNHDRNEECNTHHYPTSFEQAELYRAELNTLLFQARKALGYQVTLGDLGEMVEDRRAYLTHLLHQGTPLNQVAKTMLFMGHTLPACIAHLQKRCPDIYAAQHCSEHHRAD